MRYARRSQVIVGREAEYALLHDSAKIWPSLCDAVHAAGFRDYSIYLDGRDLFATFEVDSLTDAERRMSQSAVVSEWMDLMAPLMDAPDPLQPWRPVDQVFFLR